MNGITVPMALVDFIPVVLFFAAAVLLQRDLYHQMVKGTYALLATGSIMVLIGGLFKATWKILYALQVCDYPLLSDSFFPLQGPGFLLVFLALAGMFTPWNRKGTTTLLGVGAVPVYTSTIPFVILQTVGCAGSQWTLFAISLKMKQRLAAACPPPHPSGPSAGGQDSRLPGCHQRAGQHVLRCRVRLLCGRHLRHGLHPQPPGR